MDSANAVEFCRTLRLSADVFGVTAAVAIYQAPQAAYDLFDKVIVLYDGKQIFFGNANDARSYFEDLGFLCPEGQTTPDFLTSMTNPNERIVKPGWQHTAPRNSDDFAFAWAASHTRRALEQQIDTFVEAYPLRAADLEAFKGVRRSEQARFQRSGSPYTLSYFQQIQICLWRGFKLLQGDPTITIVQLVANCIQFLIISSIFYNLPDAAEQIYSRGMVIFISLILNAFASILEILTLYAKRRVVEKHSRYTFYHPSAEAIAAMIVDLPYKVLNAIIVNLTVYFMTNLRREPGPFAFFFLFSFVTTLTMVSLSRSRVVCNHI